MSKVKMEESNFCIQRIGEKCIDCGACENTCNKLNGFANQACVNCGQCILTCPMGALQPKYNYKEVLANLHDEEKIVVVSIAPAVRVSIGDAFSYEAGTFLEKKTVGLLKKLGFSYVFDLAFGADLTVMEEASEFIARLKKDSLLPMYTSCCPSWVNYLETFHLEEINHLSSCKSPIGMQGAMIKTYFAKIKNLNPEDIVTVTIAPCVAKKEEIKKEMPSFNDYVLTVSELVLLTREMGIAFKEVEEQEFDSILGIGSKSGVSFGKSGGVMESTLRTAYFLLNSVPAPKDFYCLKNIQDNFLEAEVDLKIVKIKVAVIFGLLTVHLNYNQLKKYHFIEVMTCPNGCVGGAGQMLLPISQQNAFVEARKKSLIEEKFSICFSYENKEIQAIYSHFLGSPLSEIAKNYLHRNKK